MTKVMNWLQARVRGFGDLSQDERDAIVDFSLLWSLFEARILNTNGNAASICAAVDNWRDAGTLNAEAYDRELAYFRQRYYANGQFTHRFDHLHLRASDRERLVRAVLNGSNNVLGDRVAVCLIIAYRYRNNLFHGVKWQYELQGQFDNFEAANAILMRALEEHGQLAEGWDEIRPQ